MRGRPTQHRRPPARRQPAASPLSPLSPPTLQDASLYSRQTPRRLTRRLAPPRLGGRCPTQVGRCHRRTRRPRPQPVVNACRVPTRCRPTARSPSPNFETSSTHRLSHPHRARVFSPSPRQGKAQALPRTVFPPPSASPRPAPIPSRSCSMLPRSVPRHASRGGSPVPRHLLEKHRPQGNRQRCPGAAPASRKCATGQENR
ncbi:hypothetical protein OF83DRAFT_94304 [Amylostereum chailletii]|nr:hypothetical protein OF83DRAFT_94304 [Amylostereum chailletii]